MTKKSDFSKQEWQMITDGPEWVFAALAAADGNVALTTKGKESKAYKKVIEDYRSRSELVAEVLGDSAKASKDTKGATLSDAEQALEEINDLLDAKADTADASDYRRFLSSLADSVAEAAGEGTLGAGKKLSDKEAKAIKKIQAALKPGKKPARKPAAKPAKRPAPAAARTSSKPSLKGKIGKRIAGSEAKVVATHTVKKNETWSHLALKYYGDMSEPYWRYMYEFNKELIGDNYKDFYAGLEIRIPELPDHMKKD
ncbi:MAG: hypothetical protein ABFS17_03310 [Chloroflexota bacterium]